MGQLEMSFVGICLHVTTGLPPEVGHRVVLVDASPDRIRNLPEKWRGVPAHFSALAHNSATRDWSGVLPNTPPQTWLPMLTGFVLPLDGWSLSVPNAQGDLTVNIGGIPSLKHFDPEMQIRQDLLEAGPPRLAACFVDIRNGHVETRTFAEVSPLDPGSYASWKVETDGAPRLQLRSRKGDELTMVLPEDSAGTSHFPFGVPGTLVLGNVTLDGTDTNDDFVLHYLANASGVPAEFPVPLPGQGRPSPVQTVFATTSSCSNSQYP